MKFTESQLERAFIELLGKEGIPHLYGDVLPRSGDEVLIKADLKAFLHRKYDADGITDGEINSCSYKAIDQHGRSIKRAFYTEICKLETQTSPYAKSPYFEKSACH